jgi:peptide/nickel transport system substrate-binding protein
VDRLIEQVGTTSKVEERADLYQELQSVLLHTLPYVPLWYEEHFFASRDSIEGYTIAADGNYDGLMHVRRH